MRYSPILLMFASTLSWSEISSLTASELTDTYIKDTTVIVRPTQAPKESVEKVRVNLKVSPIDEPTQIRPHDDERNLAGMSQELNSYTELNERAALSMNLQTSLPIATTEFLTPPPSEDIISLIRGKYGILPGEPIDLTALGFKANLTPDLGLANPSGAEFTTTESSFTITIPNTGNFNTQNISSPNGEVGVNVTPSHIEYTLNLPR